MKDLLIEVLVTVILGLLCVGEGIRIVLERKGHTLDVLGPGFYVLGVGSILIIVGLIYFVSARKKAFRIEDKSAVKQSTGKSEYTKMMISMIAVMIAYIFLMYLTGYLIASFVFFFLINKVSRYRSWLTNLGVTILMTVSFYLLFVTWLGMIFPHGRLFDF